MQKIFGLTGQEVGISIVLHLGTLLALVIFFFPDILALWSNKNLLFLIVVVTVITGAIGLAGKDFFESLFSSVKWVGGALILNGIILILTKNFMQARRINLGIKDALFLGVTQGLAIVPGISRSGITVSTLLFRGLDRETSFRFSFLASIPAILGAAILEAKKINFAFKAAPLNLALGCLFSFLSGILSLWLLKLVLRKAKLHYFGYYCFLVAIITLLFIK
jgi:undecaprenyl-diphosphatase